MELNLSSLRQLSRAGILCPDYRGIILAFISRVELFDYMVRVRVMVRARFGGTKCEIPSNDGGIKPSGSHVRLIFP